MLLKGFSAPRDYYPDHTGNNFSSGHYAIYILGKCVNYRLLNYVPFEILKIYYTSPSAPFVFRSEVVCYPFAPDVNLFITQDVRAGHVFVLHNLYVFIIKRINSSREDVQNRFWILSGATDAAL